MNAEQEFFDYIQKHYPNISYDVTLTHLVHNVWREGVIRSMHRARQIERDHELDERISSFIKNLLKEPSKPCGCDPTKGPCSYCGTLSD